MQKVIMKNRVGICKQLFSDTCRDPEQTDIQIYQPRSRDFHERVDNTGCVLRDTDTIFRR
jgi:hypothetical protein